MNSRERILNAINKKPVDHVPLYIRLWDMGSGIDRVPFDWRDQIHRVENFLRLGLDDTLLLEPPLGYTEAYIAEHSQHVDRTSVELLSRKQKDISKVLRKTYFTPKGELNQVVKTTDNWPHGDNVMLFSDHNISGYLEPLIKSHEDIDRLSCLLASPTETQKDVFYARSRKFLNEAERLGVVLDGGWLALGDSVIWLCGIENILYWQMDQPALIEAVLDVILEWEMERLSLLLDAGIDVLVYMAWYVGTDFWTPANFRRMIKPRLKQIVEKTHAANVPFRYIITKGWKPIRQDLLDLGIDCLTGIDPVQDNIDLLRMKKELGQQICLMGGMNAAVTLTQGSDAEIRQAVNHAINILSPEGGFILFPVDNFACDWPWEKAEIIIDEWKTRCF